MPTLSVLAHVANAFAPRQYENLATECLHFVLAASGSARDGLDEIVQLLSGNALGDLRYISQARGEDESIPDLVGSDAHGQTPLILESKFWAGLTDAQPVAYLRRLPAGSPGLLLFLCPQLRLETLWPELLRRLREDDVQFLPAAETEDYRTAAVGGTHTLALLTWRRLLGHLRQRLEARGESDLAGDVRQLAGLCEQMDSEAFTPVHEEELSDLSVPRRLLQYHEIVDEVISRLKESKSAKVEGTRSGGGYGWYGRGFHFPDLAEVMAYLTYNLNSWLEAGATPLWLDLYGPKFQRPPAWVRAAFGAEGSPATPAHVHMANRVTVPLYLKTRVERAAVLQDLVTQIEAVRRFLVLSSEATGAKR